jgi:hypothetical protein
MSHHVASPLPTDIITRIASILHTEGDYQTLARLCLLSQDAYLATTPILYSRFLVKPPLSNLALVVDPQYSEALNSGTPYNQSVEQALRHGTFFSAPNLTLRRIWNVRHIRHITVHSFPPDPICSSLIQISDAFKHQPNPSPSSSSSSSPSPSSSTEILLPKLRSVALLPQAVDQLRTFIPHSYADPYPLPPFLSFLVKAARPTHLCISFRLVKSSEWQLHQFTRVGLGSEVVEGS